ncbi:hypothetical protein [Halosimplex sp. TS25]|uniref:hypothetical protein n=1 Tax=Halosimplex rarum TaxID=3396619 RepID=UPI0039EBAA23
MYSLSDLQTALDNPEWFAREANRLWTHRFNLRDHNPKGIDVFAADWDNLLILDACRYDEFERACDLRGDLSKVRSRGATSSEFVRGNFTGRTLHDVVYVSANVYYPYLREEIDAEVHAFIGLHEDDKRDAGEGLTTHPETVTEHALAAHKQYPNKRLMVHYLQPHQPYIGPYGRERFDAGRGLIDTVKQSNPSREELLRAYRENLEIVLEEVEVLLAELPGKTIVTADHGEMLGERMRPIPVTDYGHHAGVYIDELLDVPWFVSENGPRKEIVAKMPETDKDAEVDSEELAAQLRALGYRE